MLTPHCSPTMGFITTTWLAACIFWISVEHSAQLEAFDASLPRYHLCSVNETRNISKVVSYKTSYLKSTFCGGWLSWKMCPKTFFKTSYRIVSVMVTKETVTCCSEYEQVGSYCALPLSRSADFTAKPGQCLVGHIVVWGSPCEFDSDCPGLQKCCKDGANASCASPQTVERIRSLNVTLTMKINYQDMHSINKGVLTHMRLLHSLVTGALNTSNVTVHHTQHYPVGPYNTASELLICSPYNLSLPDATARLQLLIKEIEVVVGVEVQDTDECSHAELNNCAPEADCINTDSSYSCVCRQGFVDLSSTNTGIRCQASPNVTPPWVNSTVTPCSSSKPYNITVPPNRAFEKPSTDADCSHSVPGVISNGTHNLTTQALNMSVENKQINSTHSSLWSSVDPRSDVFTGVVPRSSNVQPSNITHETSSQPVLTDTNCSAPIINLTATHVTGYSFNVTWTYLSSVSHTFHVVLIKGSEALLILYTPAHYWEATGLESGVMYTVRITPLACGSHGSPMELHVKTEAQTLIGKVRLVNLKYTETLTNTSSQQYVEFCQSFQSEILMSLSPTMLAVVSSGAVKIIVTSLAPGSIVVNFMVVTDSSIEQDIRNISNALLISLQNSSKYVMDLSNSTINDYDECSANDMDCSNFATCKNTWGSYICACQDGFTDVTPDRPGRSCVAGKLQTTTENPSLSMTQNPIPSLVSTTPSTTSTTTKITSSSHDILGQLLLESVVLHSGAITVECKVSEIAVTLSREFLRSKNIRESSVYLGKPECGLSRQNETYIQLIATWDKCDTKLLPNNTHYTAQVMLLNNWTSATLTAPKVLLQIPIMCTYRNSMLISTGYTPVGIDMITGVVEGSGTFQVSFQLLNGTIPLPQNYTLSSEEEVVIEVGINSTLPQMKLIINKCWATPTNNTLDLISYTFMENSCPVSNTYTTVIQNGISNRSRVGIRIFSVVTHSVIYLHCQIQICIETTEATCQPHCLERAQRSFNVIGTGKASCGPIFKAPTGSNKENLISTHEVGFIVLGVVLCLLGIGGLLVLVFYYKNHIGRYNFNYKTKKEKFIYQVFDK